MDPDFGGVARDRAAVRQGGHGLQLSEHAIRRVIPIGYDGRIEFIDQIGKPACGMKSEMPGSCSGGNRYEWRLLGLQRCAVCVIGVDQNLIHAQVGGKGKAIGGIEVDRMGMRPSLTLRIDARSRVLDDGRRIAHTATS